MPEPLPTYNDSEAANKYRVRFVGIRGKLIRLQPNIAHEDLLTVTCGRPQHAARLILDWAYEDPATVADYLARFFTRVCNELDVMDPEFPRRPGVETTFGNIRGAPAQVSFATFCELLIENPALIELFRNSPEFKTPPEFSFWFLGRSGSRLAANRGQRWDDGFIDGAPISEEARLSYERGWQRHIAQLAAESRAALAALEESDREEAAIEVASQGSLDLRVSAAPSPPQENSNHPEEKTTVTKHDLGQILNKMYFESQDGETVAMIHLFGIQYADQIKASEATAAELAKLAKIPKSYATEISKGIRLAKYVAVIKP